MTTAQLISELQKVDPRKEVMVSYGLDGVIKLAPVVKLIGSKNSSAVALDTDIEIQTDGDSYEDDL